MPNTSSFTIRGRIPRDWLRDWQASSQQQLGDCATRLAKMVGKQENYVLFFAKTANGNAETGTLTIMEHAGDTHVSPGVLQFVTFLRTLPEAAQVEITNALN